MASGCIPYARIEATHVAAFGERGVPTQIVAFEQEHAERAAEMVAARYRAEREILRLIPELYVDPSAILPRVLEFAASSPGVAAMRAGELQGFLIGMRIAWRGDPTAYVPEYGHGASPDDAYALYRAMYAEMSGLWALEGRRDHLICLFAHDRPAFDACVSLGYGGVGMDTLRDLEPVAEVADVDIRRADVGAVDLIAPLEVALREHLAGAPTFLPRDPDEPTHLATAWWLSDPERALWLAFGDGAARAFLCMDPRSGQVLPTADESTVSIIGAYTAPGGRGAGVGAALLNRGLAWATSQGYATCAVDFEVANIEGSRFWLGRGFRPVTQAMYRHIHAPRG
jgi:GNAT superfamily N-acetyltransferase